MIDRATELFEELDAKLAEEGVTLTVIAVGGFVLSRHGLRGTKDIGAFFRASALVEEAIREIGERHGVNEEDDLWLNNSVASMNDESPAEACERAFEGRSLTVLAAPLDYVAGMKLVSARGQDLDDVAAIVRKLGITDPDDLLSRLSAYGLGDVDEDLLLEAFGMAYGMDWLEGYYRGHEEEINRRVRRAGLAGDAF